MPPAIRSLRRAALPFRRPSARLPCLPPPWTRACPSFFSQSSFSGSSGGGGSGKPLPPRPALLPAAEITSKALKGTGPGGQKINKSSTAVQLRHEPTGVVVKSQATRSRAQNMKIAQRLLADRVDVLRNGREASREGRVAEIVAARKRSADRKKRRKKKREREGSERAAEDAEGEGEEVEEEEEIQPVGVEAEVEAETEVQADVLRKFYAEVEARREREQQQQSPNQGIIETMTRTRNEKG